MYCWYVLLILTVKHVTHDDTFTLTTLVQSGYSHKAGFHVALHSLISFNTYNVGMFSKITRWYGYLSRAKEKLSTRNGAALTERLFSLSYTEV